jgi:hypothetical protein
MARTITSRPNALDGKACIEQEDNHINGSGAVGA